MMKKPRKSFPNKADNSSGDSIFLTQNPFWSRKIEITSEHAEVCGSPITAICWWTFISNSQLIWAFFGSHKDPVFNISFAKIARAFFNRFNLNHIWQKICFFGIPSNIPQREVMWRDIWDQGWSWRSLDGNWGLCCHQYEAERARDFGRPNISHTLEVRCR